MWWGYHGFPFFGLIFITLLSVFLVFKIYAYRNWHKHSSGKYDAEALLKRRLANGEINESEYEHLKEVLKK